MERPVTSATLPKRPRHYAAEIIALPKAERRAALAQVPAELRDWVRHLIEDWHAKAKSRARWERNLWEGMP